MAQATDHLGNVYPSVKAMCDRWGINYLTFRHRVYVMGWDLERALTEPAVKKANPATDHLGNEFPSVNAMCKHWGIFLYTYRCRRDAGMTVEEALTTPVAKRTVRDPRRSGATDHEGNEFSSKTEMCRHWGVNSVTYDNRIRSGWSVRDALTVPVEGEGSRLGSKGKQVTDHEGNVFKTKSAMCDHWGVKLSTFDARMKGGWTLEEALTKPPRGQ